MEQHDTGKLLTELADLATDLAKGVEPPRLSIYLQKLGKWLYTNNGFGESKEFIGLCDKAQRMALKRVWGRERDLKSEVLDYFNVTNSNANITTLCRDITIVTKEEKSRLRMILSRLVNDDKILIRRGRGEYALKTEVDFEDWTEAETTPVSLWLPFELSSPDFAVLHPGDIVLIMGSPNAGKTAVTMSVAKENRNNYNVYYFSSEITASSFKSRMSKYKDCSVNQMGEIKFSSNIGDKFDDIIIPGKNNLNIIDYVELEKPYEVGGILGRIHSKLDGAICVCNIQKDPNKDYGVGGVFTQMKPMLSVSLDHPNVAKITKCKEWNERIENPNRKIYRYKLIDGCRFTRATPGAGWVNQTKGGIENGI